MLCFFCFFFCKVGLFPQEIKCCSQIRVLKSQVKDWSTIDSQWLIYRGLAYNLRPHHLQASSTLFDQQISDLETRYDDEINVSGNQIYDISGDQIYEAFNDYNINFFEISRKKRQDFPLSMSSSFMSNIAASYTKFRRVIHIKEWSLGWKQVRSFQT